MVYFFPIPRRLKKKYMKGLTVELFYLKDLFHASFYSWVYVLFQSLQDGWYALDLFTLKLKKKNKRKKGQYNNECNIIICRQKLARRKNFKLHFKDSGAKMPILLRRLLKSKYFLFCPLHQLDVSIFFNINI